jgi:hypothetical protein
MYFNTVRNKTAGVTIEDSGTDNCLSKAKFTSAEGHLEFGVVVDSNFGVKIELSEQEPGTTPLLPM